jgi:hypothetical protein
MPSTCLAENVWLQNAAHSATHSPTATLNYSYLAMWHQERLVQQHIAWLHVTVCHVMLVMQIKSIAGWQQHVLNNVRG